MKIFMMRATTNDFLHIAIKAVADDGNETCTAGRLDDCAFVGASAVEFG